MPFTIRQFRCLLHLACCLSFGLLLTLLLLSIGPVYAEWVQIGISESGMTVYVDPDTIRRKGDLVKMWTLYDYKTIQTETGDPFLSSRGQHEYDCVEERVRVITFTTFSGNMGSGKAVFTKSDEGKWQPVPPRSIYQRQWKIACGKQ